jgi:hypothetical protein
MTNAITPAVRRLIGAAFLSVALAACSSSGSSPAPASAVPSTAPASASAVPSLSLSAHVDATVAGLDAALALYKAGNNQGALDAVAETYEDHFEVIEEPLEKVNDPLKEDLEGLIATKLRQSISAKSPVADVEALVTEAKTKLATVKGLLK